ncbi:MAG TPA: hypothetical protein VMD28_09650 [Acidimicrobiales bacterium]|nr:hypothetical protein [Acidimicrobiales bacterium]
MRRRPTRRDVDTLRRMTLGAIVLVLAQAALGTDVNLYVTVPARHPGSRPSDYLTGSYHSVVWAIGRGAPALAAHAALGLALVVMAIAVAVRAVSLRRAGVGFWGVLGGLLVIGAGFNGASFLDFNGNLNSMIMALLALASIGAYAIVLFLVSSRRLG